MAIIAASSENKPNSTHVHWYLSSNIIISGLSVIKELVLQDSASTERKRQFHGCIGVKTVMFKVFFHGSLCRESNCKYSWKFSLPSWPILLCMCVCSHKHFQWISLAACTYKVEKRLRSSWLHFLHSYLKYNRMVWNFIIISSSVMHRKLFLECSSVQDEGQRKGEFVVLHIISCIEQARISGQMFLYPEKILFFPPKKEHLNT